MRAYILLEIAPGRTEEALRALRSSPGVLLADRLEGWPDIIVAVEAPDRRSLARTVLPVMACVETITEDLQLLVSQNGWMPDRASHPLTAGPLKGKEKKRRERVCDAPGCASSLYTE